VITIDSFVSKMIDISSNNIIDRTGDTKRPHRIQEVSIDVPSAWPRSVAIAIENGVMAASTEREEGRGVHTLKIDMPMSPHRRRDHLTNDRERRRIATGEIRGIPRQSCIRSDLAMTATILAAAVELRPPPLHAM
jgi:hypothetical protein